MTRQLGVAPVAHVRLHIVKSMMPCAATTDSMRESVDEPEGEVGLHVSKRYHNTSPPRLASRGVSRQASNMA